MNSFRYKGVFIITIIFFFCQNIYSQGDICTSATTLTPGTTCTFTTADNFGFTVQDLNNGTCTGNLNDDVYFQFTATEPTMTVNVDGSGSFDAVLGVFGGTCAALVQEGPCIDNTGDGGVETQTFYGLTVGQTYYILVYDWGSDIPATTTFDICVYETCPGGVPNDLCVNATGLTLGVVESTNNICASPNIDDPVAADICATTIENTVWYEFTPVDTDQYSATISNFNCLYSVGLQMAVITGSCGGPYTPVDCDAGINDAQFIFTGTAGTTYYIIIDGIDGDQCDFDILIEDACPADAGTNTTVGPIVSCANVDVNVSTVGSVNTNIGVDPCIGWGFWVVDDPLGVYTGLTDVGNPPSGGLPTDDGNFVGVWTSLAYPNANGPNAILPAENNGVTYYVAPITLSDCTIGEISEDCYDVGAYTEVYYNPEINYSSIIQCDDISAPSTQVSITLTGGNASVDGTNFTITNNGDGTLSSSTVANSGQIIVSGIPDGGTVNLTVTDVVGCSETITIGPLDASLYCSSACPGYSSVATASADACGGQLFDFDVANTECNGTINFNVVGDYGSQYANEITWNVTSNSTGNTVASGGPGANNGTFNVPVSLDPNVEGTIFTLTIDDSFGDGFNGTGGFIQVEDQAGAIISGPITGDFGSTASSIFGANVDISSATITITTPSGPVVSTVENCGDFIVQMTLDNTNFCTPINIDLPWTIICDESGAEISSGVHTVTIYPHIPTASNDIVDITWDPSTCQWDIAPQNDCDLLDVGSVFTIFPDPNTWPANTCSNGSQDFTVEYLGVAGGPDCCSTGGPLGPITYNMVSTISSTTVASSPFGGTNNSAYILIPGNGSGGNATSFSLDVSMSNYCFNELGSGDSYWVTIYVDGVIIYDVQYFPPPDGFSETFNLADIPGYNENSVTEVYIYPNTFSSPPPAPTNTTYSPETPCNSLASGEWSASTINVVQDVVFSDQEQLPANCAFVIPASYTCCVVDLPSASAPSDTIVGCVSDIPIADPLNVTNISSPCNATATFVSDVSSGNSCSETIIRTYNVTDDCGNSIDVIQTIMVEDVTLPTFTAPSALTINCEDDATDLALTGDVTDESDNCSVGLNATYVDVTDNTDPCAVIITRTWTLTDDCGNTSTQDQTITVEDVTAPTFTAPSALTINCEDDATDLALTGDVTDESDNCSVGLNATYVDVTDNTDPCAVIITRTWTLTDDCGNTSTQDQIITVEDVTAPTFTAPSALTINCEDDATDLALTGDVTDESDNCSVGLNATYVDVTDNTDPCAVIITRTWTLTDDCGNTSTQDQIITVEDVTAPTFTAPSALTINCEDDATDLALTGDVTDESDNCSVGLNATYVDVTDNTDPCAVIITRTWTLTDDCGNTSTQDQIITVEDVTAPTFTAPSALTINCEDDATDLALTGDVTDESDNCSVGLNATYVDVTDNTDPCAVIITRTWTLTDDCGNTSTQDQTITVEDVTAPTFTAPSALTINCEDDATDLALTGDVTDESDNCSVGLNATYVDVTDNTDPCAVIITRTWTLTDDCGNTSTQDQIDYSRRCYSTYLYCSFSAYDQL